MMTTTNANAMTLEQFTEKAQYGSNVRPNSLIRERDYKLLTSRLKKRAELPERPLVGDWVRLPDDSMRRVTHDWDDRLQLTSGSFPGDASFHIDREGYCSFSGSLSQAIPLEHFTVTDEAKDGSCWFFSNDWAYAHSGVYIRVPFRVWQIDVMPKW